MSEAVRIGIIGCGDVMTAYMFQIEQLIGRGQAQVTYACDTRMERREIMQTRYRAPRFTTDFHQLIKSPEVDLVIVLTSMKEHGPLSIAALEAGKHVLVEKPFAINLEQGARLVELARKSPGYLGCAPYVVLSPTYQTIARRITNGDIGKVCSARARYGHAGPTWGPWFYQAGGGAIFDLSPYNLASLTGWLGPVRSVMAYTGTVLPERIVDGKETAVQAEDNAHILLDFGENVFAVITSAYIMQQYRCPAIELYGLEGTLQMMGDDWDPEGYELWLNSLNSWQVFKETDPNWLWTDGVRHMVECIQSRRQPLITPEHAYHVLEIMVKAEKIGKNPARMFNRKHLHTGDFLRAEGIRPGAPGS